MASEAKLTNIARGGALALFDRALQKVTENIKDVNTDALKKRRITMVFECVPYKDRSGFDINVAVETKMPGPDGVRGTVYIGKEGQCFRAFTQDIRQNELFPGNSPAEEEEEEEQSQAPASPVQ